VGFTVRLVCLGVLRLTSVVFLGVGFSGFPVGLVLKLTEKGASPKLWSFRQRLSSLSLFSENYNYNRNSASLSTRRGWLLCVSGPPSPFIFFWPLICLPIFLPLATNQTPHSGCPPAEQGLIPLGSNPKKEFLQYTRLLFVAPLVRWRETTVKER